MSEEEFKARKVEVTVALWEVQREAKQLLENIDKALSAIEAVETEEDVRRYYEEHDIEKGLKHIEVF